MRSARSPGVFPRKTPAEPISGTRHQLYFCSRGLVTLLGDLRTIESNAKQSWEHQLEFEESATPTNLEIGLDAAREPSLLDGGSCRLLKTLQAKPGFRAAVKAELPRKRCCHEPPSSGSCS